MPLISKKDKRQREQTALYQEEYIPRASFGDVFSAAVGQAFDEELSVSRTLNNEGYINRKAQVEGLIDSGEVDKDKYFRRTSRGGKFDYDALAKDRDDVKTNAQLREERNALLAQRREYAEDVFSRGSGFARFLGSAVGYMMDPISVATMPIGFSTGGAKGLAAVGRAMLKAGATEMAAETGIQAFVYEHKHDIDSPYDWKDALTNIATAATAGSLLAGTSVGIREYIGGIRAKAKELPLDEQLEFADETLARMEETLSSNPLRKEILPSKPIDIDAEKVKFLQEVREELKGSAGNKITRGDRQKILSEKKELEYKISQKEISEIKVVKTKGVPARKAKKLAIKEAEAEMAEDIVTIREKLDRLDGLLERDRISSEAEANLTRAEQGLIPEQYAKTWEAIKGELENEARLKDSKSLIEADREFLEGLEIRKNQTFKSDPPPITRTRVDGDAGLKFKEKDVLDKVGQSEDYAQDMIKYKQQFEPDQPGVLIRVNDEAVDSNEFIKGVDDELDGIDGILRCMYR